MWTVRVTAGVTFAFGALQGPSCMGNLTGIAAAAAPVAGGGLGLIYCIPAKGSFPLTSYMLKCLSVTVLNALLFSPDFMQGGKVEHLEWQSVCALQKQLHGRESAFYVQCI